MGNRFHELPLPKRYKLMQEEEEQKQKLRENFPSIAAAPSCLPAKKRKESRGFPSTFPVPGSMTTFCLPAKKKVWAIQDFDLNIEFQTDAQKSEKETNKIQDTPDNIIESKDERREENSGIEVLEKGRDSKGWRLEKGKDSKVEGLEKGNDSKGERLKKGKDSKGNHLESGKDSKGERLEKGKNNVCEIWKEECQDGDVDEDDDDDGILCAICESTDGDPSDPIVFCDGCDLMVHTSCYGHPFMKGVPDGDWYCALCSASKSPESSKTNKIRKPFSCCLCPVVGGALKSTTEDGKWAHVVCALFVPEVFFSDSEGREGIDITQVPARRWKQRCYICKSKDGCAIECSEPKCPLAFHVTCGLKEDLCIEYTEGRNRADIIAGFCRTHSELWKKQQKTGKFKIVSKDKQ